MARFEVFVIDRGGGRTPKTLSPARGPAATFGREFGADDEGTFATRAEADAFIAAKRNEFSSRDQPVGVRQVPTAAQAAAVQRLEQGEEIIGPPPKGRRTTRTPEEEAGVRRKHTELTRINRELRTARSEERRRLLKERQKVSAIPASQFTKEVNREERLQPSTLPQSDTGIFRGQEVLPEKEEPKKSFKVRSVISRPGLELRGPFSVPVPPRKTTFEQAQERELFPSIKLVGREAGKAVVGAAEDIRAGVIGGVERFSSELLKRPIGKTKTGLFEETRDLSVGGEVLKETKKEKEGPVVLFPVVGETAGKVVRGAESGLKFIFEDVPKATFKVGKFLTSKEGRAKTIKVGKTIVTTIKEKPKETAIASLTLASLGTAKVLGSTAKAFKKEPAFIGTEAVVFGEAFRVGSMGIKGIKETAKGIKFEYKIKKFEKGVTDPNLKFVTESTFVPTGKPEISLGPRGIKQRVIEVEEIKPGFLVFGEAGELRGRQLQLRSKDVPQAEAQAEFAPPRLGEERIRGTLPEQESLVKFVERPLSPTQQALAREPPREVPIVKEEQLFFKSVFPPGKRGTLGQRFEPLEDVPRPFGTFERLGGEYFERIKPRFRLKPDTSIRAIQKQFVGTRPITLSKIDTRQRFLPISKDLFATKQEPFSLEATSIKTFQQPKIRLGQVQTPKLRTDLRTDTALTFKTDLDFFGDTPPGRFRTPRDPSDPFRPPETTFRKFKLKFDPRRRELLKKKKKRKGARREFLYKPSFSAIVFGTTQKLPKKVKGLTGLEPSRPIPSDLRLPKGIFGRKRRK